MKKDTKKEKQWYISTTAFFSSETLPATVRVS
jgi:hypothetical protein